MSAKSLAKRLVEISSRGGSKANTKELMKRWTGFLTEKYLADKYTGDKMSRSERTDKAARRVGLSLPKSASDAE
eukprot:g2835.t1